jgi:hypothetical protein
VRAKRLSRQLVVRVDADLYADLLLTAIDNERTIAQEVRHRLRRALGLARIRRALGQDR